jgi:hypothetical protein
MGGYPPGTGPGDPNAPWNEPDPPSCPECDRLIANEDDHEADCPMGDADAVDIAEYERDRHRKDYDDLKDEQPPPDADDTDMVIPERDDEDE